MKIGITGGIGSGKSYVCQRLVARGISVYDCDSAAKRLMRTSAVLQRKLTELIGKDAYIEGKLNKAAVAQFLLASEENAQLIANIVHPAVADDFINSGNQWMECAILYESGFDKLVDRVVAVAAPDDVRLQRVMQRDGISEQKARQWIAKQMAQDIVCSRADYVITNDGTADIDCQISEMLSRWSMK